MLQDNNIDLWLEDFPFPQKEQHKYDRGYVCVSGGDINCTGATSLAANAALRAGAGLVEVCSPNNALAVYATKLTSVMVKPFNDLDEFTNLISDKRKNVVLLGPGNLVSKDTKAKVISALSLGKKYVIDADAITSFKECKDQLFNNIKSSVIMTPHMGEFKALFDLEEDHIKSAQKAARKSGAIIILKGSDTIIAPPFGTTVINKNAPAFLATAGSGDVLSGIISGLLAQNMDPFKAACAAVWIHSKAANLYGPGMISEDLLLKIPEVLSYLYNKSVV